MDEVNVNERIQILLNQVVEAEVLIKVLIASGKLSEIDVENAKKLINGD